MGTIIGRDEELRRISRFLDQAKTQRVARVLRITGASGNGKTALARAAQEAAREAGWLCPFVAAHRIQATLPLVVARRIADELVRDLGEAGAKYVSGLEAALRDTADAPGFEAAFFRFIEASLLDQPLAIIVDDAQWSDRESGALLLRTIANFADRPFVLTIIDRSDENAEPTFDYIDETLIIREFSSASARDLVKHLMPRASDAVVDAVVHHARGRAIDIATIASLSTDHERLDPDDVAASARTIIASTIAQLKSDVREFLQICSLIGDPIEFEVLNALWPQNDVLAFIRQCSGSYLTQDDDGLRIVHLTVAQSIRETIPIAIPYRKRIIEAIESLPRITLGMRERLVEQASACGEVDLERRYLEALIRDSEADGVQSLTASALERLIKLTPFDASAIPLYSKLSMLHNALSLGDAIRTCREALERAAHAGIRDGLGQLVASLLFALLHHSDREEYARTLDRYASLLTAPRDRAHLTGVQLYVAYCDADEVSFAEIYASAQEAGIVDPLLEFRATIFKGILAARCGNVEQFHVHRAHARSVVEEHGLPQVMNLMITASEAMFAAHVHGFAGPDCEHLLRSLPEREQVRETIEMVGLIATGRLSDALERLLEFHERASSTFASRVGLGLLASLRTLSGIELPAGVIASFEREVGRVLQGGTTPITLPILAAAIGEPAYQKRYGAQLVDRVIRLARGPFELQTPWIPVVLTKAAITGRQRDILEMVADGGLWVDRLPWSLAHHRLGTLLAADALGRTIPYESRIEVARSLHTLGAPFFARLLEPAPSSGPNSKKEVPANSLSLLSKRERDVARLVSEGKTNREIAETLVLSERTVEGHVANIFNKLNVGARSQVAVWYVANAAAS